MSRLAACAIVCTGFMVAACSDNPENGTAGDARDPLVAYSSTPTPRKAFDDVFTVVKRISLEETDDVVIAFPSITPDPMGGLLVSDQLENQLKRYDADGRLLWHFGRTGQGPTEFQFTIEPTRLGDDRILVLDALRKVVVWNEATRAPDRVIANLPVRFIDGATDLGNGRVLLSTRRGAVEGEFDHALHILDLETGQITNSFFSPPLTELNQPAVQRSGWAHSAFRGDTIATVFALSDSVYLHSTAGQPLGKIALPPSGFVPLTQPRDRFTSTREWSASYSRTQRVFWSADGDLFVSYMGMARGTRAPDDNAPRWHLLALTRDGKGLFDVVDMPAFHNMDGEGNFYFADPESMLPNDIMVARLR